MIAKSATPRTDKRKARPKPGARRGHGMTDPRTDRVTEREARTAYIAMKGRRSVPALQATFRKAGRETPSTRTLWAWCAKNNWVALAREHDEKVANGTMEKIVEGAVAQAVTRAHQFDYLATDSLNKAIDGLAKINIKDLKVSDIRALAEVGERATKMFELLEGRATDRPDNMTRQKMDEVLEKMQEELEESLAGIKTIH